LNGKTLCLNNSESNSIIKPNYKKVLSNLGFQRGNQIGNLIIDFSIEFPDSLSRDQIEKLASIL
jgi:DnaJ-class molecular chaperone